MCSLLEKVLVLLYSKLNTSVAVNSSHFRDCLGVISILQHRMDVLLNSKFYHYYYLVFQRYRQQARDFQEFVKLVKKKDKK